MLNNLLLTDIHRISVFEYFKNKLEIPITGNISPERLAKIVETVILNPDSRIRGLYTRKRIKSVLRKLLKDHPISYWRGGNSGHSLKLTQDELLRSKNLNPQMDSPIINEPLLINQQNLFEL